MSTKKDNYSKQIELKKLNINWDVVNESQRKNLLEQYLRELRALRGEKRR